MATQCVAASVSVAWAGCARVSPVLRGPPHALSGSPGLLPRDDPAATLSTSLCLALQPMDRPRRAGAGRGKGTAGPAPMPAAAPDAQEVQELEHGSCSLVGKWL